MKTTLVKIALAVFVASLLIGLFGMPALADVNPVTPSTNDINRTNGWAHANQTAVGLGTTTLTLIQPRSHLACFEYRTDGDTSQKTAATNYNPGITDGLYPYKCLGTADLALTLTGRQYVEVRMVFGAESDERFDWTRFDVATVIPVSNLQPSWTASGGGGVYAAYYGPPDYTSAPVSPGSTAVYDGREAGIIKAGLEPDPTSNNYEDEGLLGFKVDSVAIATFATQALAYDVQNQSGPNPVWLRIRFTNGTTHQFVPTTNPAGWHTVDAAAGQWQLMDSNGNGTGPLMTLSQVAAANPDALVDRVYLTLGMGNTYNVSPGVGTVGWVDKVTIGLKTYDFVVPSIGLTTADNLFCVGENTTINLNLNDVVNLYGYQVKVGFDATKATASDPAFDNAWFDTAQGVAYVPSGYNADCSVAGTCAFGASKVSPATPLTGSGRIASFTLTGVAVGPLEVTINEDILTDIDGFRVTHTTKTLPLTVCGLASVSGNISLQGRATPGGTIPETSWNGKVTATDTTSTFSPATVEVTFSQADGTWTISNLPVMPTGTLYELKANTDLYLPNAKTLTLLPATSYPNQNTRLWGGDATNNEKVDIGDLGCIGGSFGTTPPGTCTGGSADINADGVINIQDLSIAGGNYGKTSPQPW